jgi:hypothetical protein
VRDRDGDGARYVEVVDGIDDLDPRMGIDTPDLDVADDQKRLLLGRHHQGLEDVVARRPEARKITDVFRRGDGERIEARLRDGLLGSLNASFWEAWRLSFSRGGRGR